LSAPSDSSKRIAVAEWLDHLHAFRVVEKVRSMSVLSLGADLSVVFFDRSPTRNIHRIFAKVKDLGRLIGQDAYAIVVHQ